MIIPGNQTVVPREDLNSELLMLEGELEESFARETFSKFLIHNAHHFTWELLTDYRLFPYQSLLLKAWISKNFSMNIISRGGAKSMLMAVFCALYPVICPNARIVICSSGFRRARSILEQVDKFLQSPGGILLKQCYPNGLKRRNDEYRIDVGEGFIVSLPLSSSSSLRGQRADVVLFDEGLLCPEDVWNEQIKPFLVAKSGIQETLRIREIEDYLIEKGILKEENREFIETTKKIIICSSASYKFEFLSRWFDSWVKNILQGEPEDRDLKGSYFVSRLSYLALPEELIEKTIINEAKESMSESTFNREYCAIFTDDSGGFFSAKSMEECTIQAGGQPCCEYWGEKGAKYILAMDTQTSSSTSADHHAMQVLKLDMEHKVGVLVHGYAKTGSFEQHAVYLNYLLKAFQPIMVITDKTGGGLRFIDSCNLMPLFKENNTRLNLLDVDFDSQEYSKVIREAKTKYNLETKTILYGQNFSSESIGRMNDLLQFAINKKKILFASQLSAQDKILDSAKKVIPEYLYKDGKGLEDFIDDIDDNIKLTKDETALIEVSISPLGARTFNLPQSLKRTDSPNRARKDSYTALLMANWMMKIYFDMLDEKEEEMPILRPFMM